MTDHGEPKTMGTGLSNAKLAMWLFLGTEIMFFSGLLGAYIVQRFGHSIWPTPADVHLIPLLGGMNTFVLICSSVTVVLAHAALHDGEIKKSLTYILITFLLGCVFLCIKAYEYNEKFNHGILPWTMTGSVPEALAIGMAHREHLDSKVKAEAEAIQNAIAYSIHSDASPTSSFESLKKIAEHLGVNKKDPTREDFLKAKIKDEKGREIPALDKLGKLSWRGQITAYKHFREHHHDDHHFPELLVHGKIWASFYFMMTGIHAIHVIGGLVMFLIVILLGVSNRYGQQHLAMVENMGLYWHFVDLVWIFLFPLIYLIG